MNIPISCMIIIKRTKRKLILKYHPKRSVIPKKIIMERDQLVFLKMLDGLWNILSKVEVFLRGDKTMETYKMKIEFNRLFNKLKENNLTQKEFKAKANISSGTMGKLINNESVTTNTICKICDYFQCLPEDIMEWIPDADYEDKQKAKAEVQAQIDELQEQLKKL